MNTFIIAEAGLNFMGSVENAIKYCEVAKEIGADAVKFQITDCDSGASKPELKQYELKLWEWKAIKRYCDKIGIEFIATPSSARIMDYIIENQHCKTIKIGSDRANDTTMINMALDSKIKTIVSNGAYEPETTRPIIRMFCTSLYPTKFDWINFDYFTPEYTGWSDHTTEYGDRIVSVIKEHNVQYYEKHLTLYHNTIDANCSLLPEQFKILIDKIRAA